MNPLIEKIRKARETRLVVGDYTLTVRRPTDLEATEMRYSGTREAVKGIARFVVGWEGVREMDLVPGGTDKAAEFDPELFSIWLEDKPDIWEDLISGVLNAYKAHEAKREASLKN